MFHLLHAIQTLPRHARAWHLETWKAIQKFPAALTASMARSADRAVSVILRMKAWAASVDTQQRSILVFYYLLVFPSAGCLLCLSSRMREHRCSWKLLCLVDWLEARCWERRGRSLRGAVRASQGEAAGFTWLALFSRKLIHFCFCWIREQNVLLLL